MATDERWAVVYLYNSQDEAEAVASGQAEHPAGRAVKVTALPWGPALPDDVQRCDDGDKVLLARAAVTLADHLDSWHGGPEEMYREATRLRQLAVNLSD